MVVVKKVCFLLQESGLVCPNFRHLDLYKNKGRKCVRDNNHHTRQRDAIDCSDW